PLRRRGDRRDVSVTLLRALLLLELPHDARGGRRDVDRLSALAGARRERRGAAARLPFLDGNASPLLLGLRHAHDVRIRTRAPCDSPFLPRDLVSRLRAALEGARADLAVAKTGEQAHPVFSLMRRSVHASLNDFLARGERKIDRWYAALAVVEVAFDDEADAFMNINTREELAGLEPPGA